MPIEIPVEIDLYEAHSAFNKDGVLCVTPGSVAMTKAGMLRLSDEALAMLAERITTFQRNKTSSSDTPTIVCPSRLTVLRIQRTTECSPAQWQGTIEDGRCLYVRFRYGMLTAGVGDNFENAAGHAMSGHPLIRIDTAEMTADEMDNDEMMLRTGSVLDWSMIDE